jgi:hypothetical protein
MRRYTPKEISFIKRHVAGRSRVEMTELFNGQHFATPVTVAQMTSFIKNNKLRNGLDGRFRPGHAPVTKGVKRFKKGVMPWNYLPVGSERINGDGYVDVKIADPKTWRAKHLLIWEAANGHVPEGHAVMFADGNRLNLEPGNLLLVTKAELAVMNGLSLISNNGELTRIGKTVAGIKIRITERKKQCKEKHK